jgi:hypothetical protein
VAARAAVHRQATPAPVDSSPFLDFARSCTIWHDKPAKPHDTRTIFYDSLTKTCDFSPKLNDRRHVMSNISMAT